MIACYGVLLLESGAHCIILHDASALRRTKTCVLCLQVSLDFKLDLPQVAVIGSQSSGKSSVLESLVRCIRITPLAGCHLSCPWLF